LATCGVLSDSVAQRRVVGIRAALADRRDAFVPLLECLSTFRAAADDVDTPADVDGRHLVAIHDDRRPAVADNLHQFV